jgi:hypothetical protein
MCILMHTMFLLGTISSSTPFYIAVHCGVVSGRNVKPVYFSTVTNYLGFRTKLGSHTRHTHTFLPSLLTSHQTVQTQTPRDIF